MFFPCAEAPWAPSNFWEVWWPTKKLSHTALWETLPSSSPLLFWLPSRPHPLQIGLVSKLVELLTEARSLLQHLISVSSFSCCWSEPERPAASDDLQGLLFGRRIVSTKWVDTILFPIAMALRDSDSLEKTGFLSKNKMWKGFCWGRMYILGWGLVCLFGLQKYSHIQNLVHTRK